MTPNGEEMRLDFRAAGNAAPYCTAGWFAPEPDETWTAGTESHLILPAPARPADYALVLAFRPLLAGARLPAQRLRVVVNNVRVGDFTVARTGLRGCLIPWAAIVLHGDALLRVALLLPDAARPADLGLNDDTRQLGLAFTLIAMYPARAPAFPPRDAAGAADDPGLAARAERLPAPELMRQFESLGPGSEFGLVQRRCGDEGLGLLRFATTRLPLLLAMLEARCDGLGRPGSLAVRLGPTARDTLVEESHYGLRYRAWVAAGEMTAAQVLARELRRLPALARKLIEDMAIGDRIFVFTAAAGETEEEVFPLALALRRLGPTTLLFVALADEAHPAGSVVAEYPGFLIGYLDRLALVDNPDEFDPAPWVRVCRAAFRLHLAGERAAAALNAA